MFGRSPHTSFIMGLFTSFGCFRNSGILLPPNDLQFRIQVQCEKAESRECCAGVPARERHLCFFDALRMAGADLSCVLHGIWTETRSVGWYGRTAYGEEVRTETADEPFDEGLEESSCCQGVAKTHELANQSHELFDIAGEGNVVV